MKLDLAALSKLAREAGERAEKATPGPWYVHWNSDSVRTENGNLLLRVGRTPTDETHPNAPFIAGARQDIPELAAAVLMLIDHIQKLDSQVAYLIKLTLRNDDPDSWIEEKT